MRIGMLTLSVYMYEKLYGGKIFAPGDLSRYLVKGLLKRGHEVIWITAPGEKSATQCVPGDEALLGGKLEMRMMQDVTPEIKERVSFFGMKTYYELDLLTRSYAMAQKEKIDVMHHFHSFGFFAHFFEELTGIPTVYTLHDPMPTQDMFEYWMFRRFPTHKFISISDRQRGDLGEHFVGTVYNGIDIDKYAFDPVGSSEYVTVGRLIEKKGASTALEVMQRLGGKLKIATWLSDRVRASSYYRDMVLPLVQSTGSELCDFMSSDDMVKLYQKSKAFLFPIHWEEPFGMVMIEAMACGTPVIAYNRGSVAEIVRDGVTGFIVDEGSEPKRLNLLGSKKQKQWIIKKQGIEGLVEAIKRIGEIDRAACRRHVEENFTVDKMVEGYENVYKKVLASKG